MWQSLKQAEIDQAKLQLERRREDMLRQHAAEIERLAADEADIETLDRLADEFAQKFAMFRPAPPSPRLPTTPAVSHNNFAPRHAAEPRPPERRDTPRTNFEMFTRAMAKAGF